MNSAFQTFAQRKSQRKSPESNRGGDWEHAGNAHRTGGLQGNCAEFVEKCHLDKKKWKSRYTQVDLAGYFLGRFFLFDWCPKVRVTPIEKKKPNGASNSSFFFN